MTNREEIAARALKVHRDARGKLFTGSKVPVETMADLALAYTPGVAEPCREIVRNPDAVYEVTSKWNTVAVITDGSAVLGLGDIGPEASLPVMEGKSVLFKRFADIDSFPLALRTQDVDAIVETAWLLTPGLGGINLEDISAPRCFEIERRLQEKCDIPVFHDDQHGTAVISLAGLLNALKIVEKKLEDVKIVLNGAGAAGGAICRYLIAAGARNVVLCDRAGALYRGRAEGMNAAKEELAALSNPAGERGSLADVIRGADVFMGISAPGTVTGEMVRSMGKRPVVFAMANPTPEIYPDEAKAAGAAVVATGRSDFPNQVNNCLGFPGIFRGALNARSRCINEEMKLAATYALAELVGEKELNPDYILPEALDARVVPAVAERVAEAARRTGVARV
ncbi:NAD(P)-dependent malic enzyme [Fretibacterium sp. OH1220_COT-178]|uniref:NAD(P)-dependent malic enzyme n=1 Tax=Fretibacterium sp. OH1220_COT-178 TaxID=2491047 RepID=UPI000F5F7A9A|nr:malic enzyme-like NAD(P)-binding protein [Fretibacterium sp. OH1220_COT-178]RRD64692.1 NAD-dependent malic enzyme [Fretibacterium sp. OH1220_COT-178]